MNGEAHKAWLPEQMEPGMLYLLERSEELDAEENPYWAVLACPTCGTLGMMTWLQYCGQQPMICGSGACSAEYTLSGDLIHYRAPQ